MIIADPTQRRCLTAAARCEDEARRHQRRCRRRCAERNGASLCNASILFVTIITGAIPAPRLTPARPDTYLYLHT